MDREQPPDEATPPTQPVPVLAYYTPVREPRPSFGAAGFSFASGAGALAGGIYAIASRDGFGVLGSFYFLAPFICLIGIGCGAEARNRSGPGRTFATLGLFLNFAALVVIFLIGPVWFSRQN